MRKRDAAADKLSARAPSATGAHSDAMPWEGEEERGDVAAEDWLSAWAGERRSLGSLQTRATQRPAQRRKCRASVVSPVVRCVRRDLPSNAGLICTGPVAQWITRLTTDQKILGSTPGWLETFLTTDLPALELHPNSPSFGASQALRKAPSTLLLVTPWGHPTSCRSPKDPSKAITGTSTIKHFLVSISHSKYGERTT